MKKRRTINTKALQLATPPPDSPPRLSFGESDDNTDGDEVMSGDQIHPSRPLSVTIPHPSCQGLSIPDRPSLQDVLADRSHPPYTLSAFTAYLSQNHCLETLEFLMDADRYRKNYHDLSTELAGMGMAAKTEEWYQARRQWWRLLNAYIVPGSPREVNLTADVRDALLALPYDVMPPPPEALDGARKLAQELMDESIFVPFLNSRTSFSAPQSYTSPYVTGPDSVPVSSSYPPRKSRRARSKHRTSSPTPTSDLMFKSPITSVSQKSNSSSLSSSLGRMTRSSVHSNASPGGSVDLGLTSDSGSSSSPQDILMTPPTTPPGSELGGSPKSRTENTWKRMTRNLGWKKKSIGGFRDSRIAPSGVDEQ
ncbi:MAG: hypothetical protein M1834_003321 [Cirrosporium novae-zelandiae]|nr:MAG: hypothetical protein M1834_003321 [Cirrosporium novae-zelandiae]